MYDKTFNMLLESNSRIFVYEDETWAVKGRYENALEDNDDAMWTFDEGFDILRLLIVSKLYFLIYKLLTYLIRLMIIHGHYLLFIFHQVHLPLHACLHLLLAAQELLQVLKKPS